MKRPYVSTEYFYRYAQLQNLARYHTAVKTLEFGRAATVKHKYKKLNGTNRVVTKDD